MSHLEGRTFSSFEHERAVETEGEKQIYAIVTMSHSMKHPTEDFTNCGQHKFTLSLTSPVLSAV